MDVPAKSGTAAAGTAAPIATTAMSAPATALFVIALRTPEAIVQLIYSLPCAA